MTKCLFGRNGIACRWTLWKLHWKSNWTRWKGFFIRRFLSCALVSRHCSSDQHHCIVPTTRDANKKLWIVQVTAIFIAESVLTHKGVSGSEWIWLNNEDTYKTLYHIWYTSIYQSLIAPPPKEKILYYRYDRLKIYYRYLTPSPSHVSIFLLLATLPLLSSTVLPIFNWKGKEASDVGETEVHQEVCLGW